jgi:TonB family protein
MKKLTVILIALAVVPALLAQGKKMSHAEAVAMAESKVAPVYPPTAKQMRVEGTVEVDVTIAADGQVEKAEPVSGNPLLTRAAVDAVKRWKFKSGPGSAVLSFNFKL